MSLNQRYYLGAAAVILAALAGVLVAYPHLPNMVPLHWDVHGNVNRWGPKWSLFMFPAMMIGTVGLFAALPWLSPRKFEVESFPETYLYIMIIMVAMFAYIEILILIWSLGFQLDIGRAVEGGVCLLIALLGNVLGKVRRNFFVGIRTPWTLANERVWYRTHRLAARTFFAGGLLGLMAVLFRAPFWLPVTAILAAAFIPVVYSLICYKQLEHDGQLN